MQRWTLALALASAVVFAAVGTSAAQDAQNPAIQSSPAAPASADFLFGRPHMVVGARSSWLFARTGSDLFDFVRKQLTIDKNAFNTAAWGFDVAYSLTPRIDISGDFEFNSASVDSEYRDFVDNKLLPINQTTRLRERGFSASVRYLVVPRGRSVSRYAWVPRGVTPYLGAGGGALWYKFDQDGDFVDFKDFSVFNHYFSSEGVAPSAHAFGGADVHIYRALFLTGEGRYVWAKGKLGKDFVGFEPIDLAGFRATAGVHVLF